MILQHDHRHVGKRGLARGNGDLRTIRTTAASAAARDRFEDAEKQDYSGQSTIFEHKPHMRGVMAPFYVAACASSVVSAKANSEKNRT
jgi:hypothetical protein